MRRAVGIFVLGGLALAACGADSPPSGPAGAAGYALEPPTEAVAPSNGDTGEPSPEQSTAAAPDDAPATSIAVAADGETPALGIDLVRNSIVKIAAEAPFVDPPVGPPSIAAGVGTGVIIGEDGLVVTNSHVVTGAARVRAYLAGGGDPVDASVLGVSECADLAVIRLDGAGYVPLGFREAPVAAGDNGDVAGFPNPGIGGPTRLEWLETTEYTLTPSSMVPAPTLSGSTWGTGDGLLATNTPPGIDHGGPLVDADGRIVGFSHVGAGADDQSYAIGAAGARSIIERLQAGEDVDSIGVNGQAFFDWDAGVTGIWVANVAGGSPAATAGIEAGDLITRLAGLDVGADATMGDYCEVIRTQGAGATLDVEVLRRSSGEMLTGQLNGTPLTAAVAGPSPAASYDSYLTIQDETGAISVSVPAEWSDVDGTFRDPWFSLRASPPPPDDDRLVPAMLIQVSDQDTSSFEGILAASDFSMCEPLPQQPASYGGYSGFEIRYVDCLGQAGAEVRTIALNDASQQLKIQILIQSVDARDEEAAATILDSFQVNLAN